MYTIKTWYWYVRYCMFRKHDWFMDQPEDPSVGIMYPAIMCGHCGKDATLEETKAWMDNYDPTPYDGNYIT
mgnify:CR=1 FL=1